MKQLNLNENNIFVKGDRPQQADYPIIAKQAVLEKVLNTICNWYNDDNCSVGDLKWDLRNELDNLEKKCDYCLESQLCDAGIHTQESVGWYEWPERKWTNEECDYCHRTVPQAHLM